jgi:hypothetical protein
MRRSIAAIWFAAFFIVVGISNAHARKPDWIDGTSKKYPSPRYFIGVGSVSLDKGGEKQKHKWAGDRARAEIAKTLRSEVRVFERMERTVETSPKGPRAREVGVSRQNAIVTTSANEVLEGVEIKEYHKDKRDRMLYALAVLDRWKAAKRTEKRANSVKSEMLNALEEGGARQNDGRYLAAIGYYHQALELAGALVDIQEMMSVLKPAGPSPFADAVSRQANIKKLINEMKDKIRFTVKVEGPASKVQNYMIQGLAKAGYVMESGTQAAGKKVYELVGTTDVTFKGSMKMDKDLIVQVYQADLDLEVKDPASGETVGTLTWSASMNEKAAEMAKKNAVRALGRHVQNQIAERLANLL